MRGYRHHKVGPLGLHHTPRVIGRSPVSLTTIANFKLTLIKSPHFCAAIHGYDYVNGCLWILQSQSLQELTKVLSRRILWC